MLVALFNTLKKWLMLSIRMFSDLTLNISAARKALSLKSSADKESEDQEAEEAAVENWDVGA